MKNFTLTIMLTALLMTTFCIGNTADLVLTWTASGDDGNVGTATAYDMRFAQDSTALVSDWDNQTIVSIPFAPKPAGETETYTITNFPTGELWFYSVKAIDEVGNAGALGNIMRAYVADNIAPASIVDLRILE